jgi:hypothetical protein
MPRLSNSLPKYRKHKASGQAIVTLNGRDIYLGPHGTKASKREYDRIIGEWLQNGRQLRSACDVRTHVVQIRDTPDAGLELRNGSVRISEALKPCGQMEVLCARLAHYEFARRRITRRHTRASLQCGTANACPGRQHHWSRRGWLVVS